MKPDKVPSLHQRILFWLLIPLAAMSIAQMVEVFYSTRDSLVEVGDRLLLASAVSISEHSVGTGGDLFPHNIQTLIESSLGETILYKVVGPDNAYISGYDGIPDVPDNRQLEGGIPVFYNTIYDKQKLRVVALKYFIEDRSLSGWISVFVAQTVSHRDAQIKSAVIETAARLLFLIIVTVALTWFGISRGLVPLTRLRESIARRSYDDLAEIRRPMPREIGPMVSTLNALFTRLDQSIDKNKRFVANASHQLRTPVTALLAQAEQCQRKMQLGQAGTAQELDVVIERAGQMARLINQLLLLARVEDIDRSQSHEATLDLVQLAKNVTLHWINDHHTQSLDLGFDSELETLNIHGNEVLLQEMLLNLIENAEAYCPAGAQVTVRVRKGQKCAMLEVEDNGPGIPAEDRERVLERFARLQEDRQGTGLGLAIASEVARYHQAILSLHDGHQGRGLLVRLQLPDRTGDQQ